MKTFEFIVNEKTKYRFWYQSIGSGDVILKYLYFEKIEIGKWGSSRLSSSRLITDGKIIWMQQFRKDDNGADHLVDSPEARHYMEKITKNLAFI